MRPWSQAEDEYMRHLFAEGLDAGQIAPRLGRSRDSVHGRAWRLGVYTESKDDRAQQVARHLNAIALLLGIDRSDP